MSKETKIKGIKLQIAGKEIELTLEQAKDLKGVLDELFPQSKANSWPIVVEKIVEKRFPENPYWQQPYVTWCDTGSSDDSERLGFVCLNTKDTTQND